MEQPEWVLGLNTIASSPLNTNLPSSLGSNSGAEGDADRLLRVSAKCGEDSANRNSPADSGCSDTNETDAQDVFADTEANTCSCDENRDGLNDDGEMFELEMNNDIDLEKIEKD